MDQAIMDFVSKYYMLFKNIFYIGGIIVAFTCIAGCIRFGIAIYRRHKGIYPPAASQMEDH